MRIHFSTDQVLPPKKFEAWRDFCALWACGATIEAACGPEDFAAEARGCACGEFSLLDVRTAAAGFRRSGADVARDSRQAVLARRMRRPMRLSASRGAPAAVDYEIGDFCIVSAEWPLAAETRQGEACDLLVIPLTAIAPHLTGGRLTRPVRASAASPLGALLAAAFDAAHAQAPLLPEKLAEGVFRNLAGLVALASEAAEPQLDPDADPVRASQFSRAMRYIDAHLAEPNLDPTTVSAVAGVSVRQLHRLFEPSGTTFARYVQRQRLLRCRDAIAGATGSGRSVLDIAYGWGFSSMATFYRAYAAEFGASPTAMRAAKRDKE